MITARRPAKLYAKGIATLVLGASLMLGSTIPAFADVSTPDQVVAGDDVQAVSLSAENVSLEYSSATYAGESLTPKVTVSINVNDEPIVLTEDVDYTVSYESNISVGEATVRVTACEGSGYTGSVTVSFEIVSPDKSVLNKALTAAQSACDGVEESDTGAGLVLGQQYASSESFDTLRSAMSAAQTILDKSDVTESEVAAVTESLTTATNAFIEAKLVATGQKIEIEVPPCLVDLTYNGLEQEAVAAGEGYVLENASATDAGSYVAIATLVDTETSQWSDGTTEPKEIAYTIKQASITGGAFELSSTSYTYNAQSRKPSIKTATVSLGDKTTSLKNGTDYAVSYKNNVKAGTASVTITGKGNFTGSVTKKFTIKKASIAKGAFTLKTTSYTYNGQARKPGLKAVTLKLGGKTVSLKSGADYILTYKNNVKAGTATVTITGKGNFTGSVTRKFTIKKASFSGAKCTVKKQLYTGKALKPNPTVKWNGITLKKGVDYTLTYKNNVKVGTATVVVTAKGNFSGKKTLTFSIYQRSISGAKVASIGTVYYTGGDIKPNPKVTYGGKTLKKGTDYTLSYKNNRYGGTASVIVTGKGSYKGTKTVNFKIDGPKYYGYTVYITNTGEKYHRSGCRYLKSRHAVDLGVARYEGYEPCKVCRP